MNEPVNRAFTPALEENLISKLRTDLENSPEHSRLSTNAKLTFLLAFEYFLPLLLSEQYPECKVIPWTGST